MLVPAFMHVLGGWNWWAPKPLVWLRDRTAFSESGPEDTVESRPDRRVVAAAENH